MQSHYKETKKKKKNNQEIKNERGYQNLLENSGYTLVCLCFGFGFYVNKMRQY